jgi:OOP family OmpA-OmpF porin
VLDILGKRMLQQPKAVLTLTGTTDGKEGNSASERISLAENRAKNVSKYLQQRWNIAPERMNIVARGLPEIPTSSEYTEGFAENRRVEISASEPEILAPVLHEQFIEYAPVRQSQEFTLTLSPGIQADRWEYC